MAAQNAINNVQFTSTNIVIFTSNGTYTPPANLLWAQVECVGGGGGSGGVAAAGANTTASSGSGGSGGYTRKLYSRAGLLPNVSVTIGAGGVRGNAGTNNGMAGGNTIFLGMTSGGGAGGQSAAAGVTSASEGGIGGTAAGGDLNVVGNYGMAGATVYVGGVLYATYTYSTASRYAPGGQRNGSGVGTGFGVDGSNYGGGACGVFSYPAAVGPFAGFNGAAGFVLITEFLAS